MKRSILGILTISLVWGQEYKSPSVPTNKSEPLDTKIQEAQIEIKKLINDTSPVVLKDLRGIWLHANRTTVERSPKPFDGLRFQESSEVNQSSSFKSLLENHIGKRLSMNKLSQIKQEILNHYRGQGYPIVDLVVPEQDLTDGVLQFIVIESKVGKITVEGNRWFSGRYIKKNFKVKSGDSLYTTQIFEEANRLTQNPFLRVQPLFGKGDKQHTTDLIMKAEDRFPARFFSSYENSGNELLGENNFTVGGNYANLWGEAHSINYQYTRSEKSGALNSHAISYLAPFVWGHSLSVTLSSTKTEALQSGIILVKGNSEEAAIRYNIPLKPIKTFNHGIYGGYDYKRSKNALEFAQILVVDNTTDIGQFVAGYNGSMPDSLGNTGFDFSMIKSTPGWWSKQKDDLYNSTRIGSDDNYLVLKLNASRHTKLPFGMMLVNTFNGQWSDDNLLNTEQISVTGANAVRGYDPGTFSSLDHGFYIRNDILAPLIGFSKWDQWRFLTFIDFAYVGAKEGLIIQPSGESNNTKSFSSAGVGLRLKLTEYANVSGDYGFQLGEIGGTQKDHRGHIRVSLQY